MSLVGGFPHHPVVHHEGYPFAAAAAAAAAATRCGHEENPYFHGWLISSHPEMSPPDYSMALSYSPEYANGAPGMDHSHYGGVPPGSGPPGLGGPRPVKRRGTANRKERRRTQSINSAFAELRECIPNVPADTKLSKIKTLRLATSYIAYLMDLLAKDDQNGEAEAFKAEIKKTDVKEEKRKKELVSTAGRGGRGSLWAAAGAGLRRGDGGAVTAEPCGPAAPSRRSCPATFSGRPGFAQGPAALSGRVPPRFGGCRCAAGPRLRPCGAAPEPRGPPSGAPRALLPQRGRPESSAPSPRRGGPGPSGVCSQLSLSGRGRGEPGSQESA